MNILKTIRAFMQLPFKAFQEMIDSHASFLLTTHLNPDGDGLGSEVALALYIESLGKQVMILNCDKTPENYSFLHDIHPINTFDSSIHGTHIESVDVIILLDTNHIERTAALAPFLRKSTAKKVCIDHHPEPGDFADLFLIDEQAPAAGEIIYNFLTYLQPFSLNTGIATALYTAIMTDTGSFRFPKTDEEVHAITAQLIRAGADSTGIYQKVYENASPSRMRLLGMALAGMQFLYGEKLAYIVLTKEMFESAGATEDDTDAFVPYTLNIAHVRIGLMFSELPDMVKINFRSKGNIAINTLAKHFGGNGHANAAGARIPGAHLNEILPDVLKEAEKYLH